MNVKAWNNGTFKETGVGYGIRIGREDRELYFNKKWNTVIVQIADEEIQVNLSSSFWNKCPELRNSKIGKWIIKKGYHKWPKGKPPKFILIPLEENKFILKE